MSGKIIVSVRVVVLLTSDNVSFCYEAIHINGGWENKCLALSEIPSGVQLSYLGRWMSLLWRILTAGHSSSVSCEKHYIYQRGRSLEPKYNEQINAGNFSNRRSKNDI